jgi:signal transduction histidine kinase/DNA-binding response OmpR family regulator
LKTISFIIISLLILLLTGNSFPSITANNLDWEYQELLPYSSMEILTQQDIQYNKWEDTQSYYEKGLALYKSDKYFQAEKVFLKVVKYAENTDEKEIRALSLLFLGNIESWKSNFPQSILYHKKARASFYDLNNLEYLAISNINISSRFKALAEYDSAIVYLKKNIETQEDNNYVNKILKSYQGLVGLYAKLSNYKNAYRYLQEGIKYAEETGNKVSLAKLYFTAGQLFLDNHVNKDIALEYLLEAKNLFEELNNSDYLNLVKLSIGDVHYKTGNDSLAMHFYKEVSTNLNKSNYTIIARANHKIGMVHKRRKEYDSTLVFLKKSIDGMCDVCPEIQIHNTLIEAGNLFLINGKLSKAFKLLNRARKIAVQSESGLQMVISFEELGKSYQTINKIDSSLFYLNEAYSLAKELGLLQRIKSSAESLSKIYYSRGAFQASSDYLKISNQMSDSLAVIEKYSEIAKLEMRFEIKKNEEERKLEAQLLQSELTKQKLIRNTSVAGAVLFIIIGIVLLRAYRSKRKANKLLEKQKIEIQEVSKQLQESGKRKLDFFTNISHEIRTPLTLIKSPLERVLKTDNKKHEIDSQLQIALNNTNKLKELVNQILDLQKLDENLLGLDLSNFELIAFCQEIVSSFEGYCYQSNCKLIFESNVGKVIIKFDQIRLQSIINNLLSNAFKFNKENGIVQFDLEVNTSQIKLRIKDTGIGISNEHLKKLGERYYQIEQSNASVEGTGIGLAYVNELVQLMKGSIEISSIEKKGSSVTISLPSEEIKIQTETPVSMEIKARQQIFDQLEEQLSDNTNGAPCILIIEDNVGLRMFLRDLFAPSYQIICAKDGYEGKNMALKHIPDLIISDITMPGIKGNELCKILKNDINTSHITVILFTAKGAPDSIVDGYDCGADDYIVKPFDSELLVKKVRNIISTGENARKQFSFTDIEQTSIIYSEFDKKFFKDAISIIKDNLGNSNFTVELLAEKMNVHRRTLLRKFNSLTGKSPKDLIRHTRMSQAADLISNKKYRVNEVAFMVGYEDTNRFSQAFKQFHGISPSAYC